MDPNATLRELKDVLSRLREDRYDSDYERMCDMEYLTELAEAMVTWLSSGGFLPDEWKDC